MSLVRFDMETLTCTVPGHEVSVANPFSFLIPPSLLPLVCLGGGVVKRGKAFYSVVRFFDTGKTT